MKEKPDESVEAPDNILVSYGYVSGEKRMNRKEYKGPKVGVKDARRVANQRDLDMVVVLGVKKESSVDGVSVATYGKTDEDALIASGMGSFLYYVLLEHCARLLSKGEGGA